MSCMSELDLRIEEVINKFNYKAVIKSKLTERTEEQLKKFSRSLLEDAVLYGYAACEGLIARYDNNRLVLSFVLEEVDESYDF